MAFSEEEDKETSCSLPVHTLEGLGRIHEKVAIDNMGRGPPNPDHAGTLISDFQPPDCEEPPDFKQNKFLLSYLVCGICYGRLSWLIQWEQDQRRSLDLTPGQIHFFALFKNVSTSSLSFLFSFSDFPPLSICLPKWVLCSCIFSSWPQNLATWNLKGVFRGLGTIMQRISVCCYGSPCFSL